MSKTLIIIAGPTATGKTALAIQLAKQFKTEIISADSRQFYREMNIGTAKPSKEELEVIPHHLIDSHSIVDSFSVGDFEKEVINLLKKLFKSHNQVVLVGGSGLFINAIPADLEILDKLKPIKKLAKTVTLKSMKSDERLSNLALIKQSRLSVTPVLKAEFDIILSLAE
jgi:tRNA dimethylallyltransferase